MQVIYIPIFKQMVSFLDDLECFRNKSLSSPLKLTVTLYDVHWDPFWDETNQNLPSNPAKRKKDLFILCYPSINNLKKKNHFDMHNCFYIVDYTMQQKKKFCLSEFFV